MSSKVVHFQAQRINTITPTTSTYYLSADESGSIVFCNTGITLYLPPLGSNNNINKGLNFTIIVLNPESFASSPITLKSINDSSVPTNLMIGNGVPHKAASLFPINTFEINANVAIGDRINCVCDGKTWYLNWNLTTTTSSDLALTS